MDFTPGGGTPALVPSDVSAALAYGRISEPASLFARIKYCLNDTPQCRNRLLQLMVMDKMPDIVQHKSWQDLSMEFISSMMALALSEALSDVICRTCRGAGSIEIDQHRTPCEPCGGSGRKSFSDRHIARRLGLDSRNYARRYRLKYRQLLGLFFDLESEAAAAGSRIG